MARTKEVCAHMGFFLPEGDEVRLSRDRNSGGGKERGSVWLPLAVLG